jgi:hypothetical protein
MWKLCLKHAALASFPNLLIFKGMQEDKLNHLTEAHCRIVPENAGREHLAQGL